jgi:DNA-binding transcriptional regulator YhcF (GntR family)
MARHNKTGRSKNYERFVALNHSLLNSKAWQDLRCVARCTYVEIAKRYAGRNNGRIPFSIREVAEALHCSRATAMRALDELQDHGFLVVTKKGAFNIKHRMASEWRLTEHGCDVTDALATKDYARWVKKQNTVSNENPDGCQSETERVSE